MNLTVKILVTVPKEEHFDACTLCFDSLRAGFPTAKIEVTANAIGWLDSPGARKRLLEKVKLSLKPADPPLTLVAPRAPAHHARWIQESVEKHPAGAGPLVLLDADTIFWKSCEGWKFTAPIAGYRVPLIWNDFAKCVSMPRVHTSFLWINDTRALTSKLVAAYTPAHREHGDYCPCNPYAPDVRFIGAIPIFWDTCANLSGMAGPEFFEGQHLECYDHLNSAGFYEVMLERLEAKEMFAYAHYFAVQKPEVLRNSWPIVNAYYAEKHAEGVAYLRAANLWPLTIAT